MTYEECRQAIVTYSILVSIDNITIRLGGYNETPDLTYCIATSLIIASKAS